MIVTQQKAAKHHLARLKKALAHKKYRAWVLYVPDGEKAKSRETLFGIYRALLRQGFERRDLLIALGGGVVGDLTGFAAATYLRGISWINVATTLLAQVDSAIGGKTGINLEEGKNLIGAFYPPKAVISDVCVLRTLPAKELRASLAEVIKYGMIRNRALFGFLEDRASALLLKSERAAERVVMTCAGIKADVVSRDEFEKSGERMILNYGHTFGHAIERVLRYRRLVHGEAVAVGMVAAAEMAVRLGLFSSKEKQRQDDLIRRFSLPADVRGLRLSGDRTLSAMSKDKKKNAGRLRFVLPQRIGRVVIREGIEPRIVRMGLRSIGVC